jgi:hypothetical protein
MCKIIKNVKSPLEKKPNLKYKKMPARVYYLRFMNSILAGFFMFKTQTELITKNVIKFILNNLKLKVTQRVLKHTFCDKTFFLGFNIRMISPSKFMYSKKKKLEAYKRHKNRVLRRGTQEHEKFLKMIEWLGRKTIANIMAQETVKEKNIMKKIIPITTKQEN